MGYVNRFYVEARAFELSVDEGGSFLQLVERRRGLARVVVLRKWSIVWLKNSLESLLNRPVVSEFIDTCREGNTAFIAQRGVNNSGRFLVLAEYVVGGQKGLIIIPKGREGWVPLQGFSISKDVVKGRCAGTSMVKGVGRCDAIVT
jgi:hypothetical protein